MMNRNWLRTVAITGSATAVLFGCQSQDEDQQDTAGNETGDLSVVTSFLPMYEFTKEIAGDRADVQLLVSEGQDAHHFEPSAQDVATVSEADVFVYSSEEMEFWVESLFNSIENDSLVIARAADGVEGFGHDQGEHDHDNHEHEHLDSLHIHGVSDHYHTGGDLELTAELGEDVDYDHWHWYQRTDENAEWQAISGQSTDNLSMEVPEESFEVQAILYDNNHEIYAESDAVEIVVDNHEQSDQEHGDDHEHGDHDHGGEAAITVNGVADHYHTGDVVSLVAETEEDVDFDHWHWFMRTDENQEWEAVSGQESNRFEYKTTGESFELKAELYNDDHEVYAESAPISILIDDHESADPHIWLDPVLAQDQVVIIRDALIEADPDGKETYEENAETFINELKSLDEDYQSTLADAENRTFVVQHQAFGYLANRYNLEQIAVGGLSTEVEPSPSRIAEIGELVKENDVPVIYFQQGANSSIAQTVATETNTETAPLYDLEVLTDELKEKELSYIAAMRENLESLQLSVN